MTLAFIWLSASAVISAMWNITAPSETDWKERAICSFTMLLCGFIALVDSVIAGIGEQQERDVDTLRNILRSIGIPANIAGTLTAIFVVLT